MAKLKSFVGFFKMFCWLAASEWREMDHRLFRIIIAAASFTFWALLWLFFFKSGTPFG